MKPARSGHSTATLPMRSMKARQSSTTPGAVRTVGTISTSFMIAAGLKKCRPRNCSGRPEAMAHSMTGSDEVVEVITAPGRSSGASSANSACFTSRSSTIASMTMSQSARSAQDCASKGVADKRTERSIEREENR